MNNHLKDCGILYNVLFVDDGSTDDTFVALKQLFDHDNSVRAIKLSRNFGKEIAISAGLKQSNGDAAVIMDVDMQHPFEIVLKMIDIWKTGCPVVLAKRKSRHNEFFLRRFFVHLFYYILNCFSRIVIPKNVGDFRLIDKEVVKVLNQMPEKTRFMKGLFAWVGFESTTIEFEPNERAYGNTRFSFLKLWNLAWQGITSFSDVLIKFSSYVGFIITFFCCVWMLFNH